MEGFRVEGGAGESVGDGRRSFREAREGSLSGPDERLHDEAAAAVRSLHDSLSSGSLDGIRRAASSFRDLAGAVGATGLLAEARRLELLGKDGDLQGARGVLPDLEQELSLILWRTPAPRGSPVSQGVES